MKFTEEKLEEVFIELLEKQGYDYHHGNKFLRNPGEVIIKEDLIKFLKTRYRHEEITDEEIKQIIRKLEAYPSSDLYESNKAIMKLIADGFMLKREDRSKKDIYIQLIDYSDLVEHKIPDADTIETVAANPEQDHYGSNLNILKFVNQFKINQYHERIPDGIIFINGLPLVVLEFKSAIRVNAKLYDGYDQLTNRYKRDIPELFKYNAFCVISDGANTKAGSFFAGYEFFYAWRKVKGNEATNDVNGIESLYTLVQGMLDPFRIRDIIRNFIYIPDDSKEELKIVCRYPQYYAANKLYDNIQKHQKPEGDGKGGTYFGATGCGKSYTMLFLSRIIMKSLEFSSPTIIVITDRTDLDEQLGKTFVKAKKYIGDSNILSVESRNDLRTKLRGIKSGGVFLTTIHKFTEDTELLTDRNNVICISDEAHRTQTNLDQKITVTNKGVKKTYGFAKYLHDSLPNATYVGFTGTPVDATLDVFGPVVDAYTMTESVTDKITKKIVYEGRAAKVLLNNSRLQEIEKYYEKCAEEGANEYQIDESKKAMANMNAIIGDPDRIKAVALDFITHYEGRIKEGATVCGKAMFVCMNRKIAYMLYKEILALRPEWGEKKLTAENSELSEKEKKKLIEIERVNMVMTRGKDDPPELYDLLGNKKYRAKLDSQFKFEKSNFKIAIVVDMWLTGFDVPFLDTMYIDKPIKRHNLIQTISRVNRNFEGKKKGLVVDYIGIKKQMNLALALYNTKDQQNFEDIQQSVTVVKDHLDLLDGMFHTFDSKNYYSGKPSEQLATLNKAAEFVQVSQDKEKRFMNLVKRMKAAYDICVSSDDIVQEERDSVHFYIAVRSIVFKLTKGEAPDTAQMNAKVSKMIQDAIESEGVEELFKMGEDDPNIDIFSDDYLEKIEKIKLPNTKIKLLQKLLAKAIDEFKKVNKAKGVDFSDQMKKLVDRYNERKETDSDILRSEVLEDFTDEIINLYKSLLEEKGSFKDLGIDFEEKAFYDILVFVAKKYDFEYPEDKLIMLSKKVKEIVDDKVRYTDWNKRDDIKAELKANLVVLLAENDYPPIAHDDVYKEIFEQAENFKKHK